MYFGERRLRNGLFVEMKLVFRPRHNRNDEKIFLRESRAAVEAGDSSQERWTFSPPCISQNRYRYINVNSVNIIHHDG